MRVPILSSRRQPPEVLAGTSLVADFVAAMTNLSTAKTAEYVAERTERAALETFTEVGRRQAAPADAVPGLEPGIEGSLVRASLDAHLQKAQAQQINAFTNEQLDQMERDDKRRYAGKKVKVTILDPKFEPVETFWLNSNTGQYDRGTIKFKSFKGVVDELSFRKNLLVIKPTRLGRLVSPQRKFIFVYVVNPATLEPAVELTF